MDTKTQEYYAKNKNSDENEKNKNNPKIFRIIKYSSRLMETHALSSGARARHSLARGHFEVDGKHTKIYTKFQ